MRARKDYENNMHALDQVISVKEIKAEAKVIYKILSDAKQTLSQ